MNHREQCGQIRGRNDYSVDGSHCSRVKVGHNKDAVFHNGSGKHAVDGRVGVLFAWRVTCSLAMKDHSRVRVALEAARARVQEVEALPPCRRTNQQVFSRSV